MKLLNVGIKESKLIAKIQIFIEKLVIYSDYV